MKEKKKVGILGGTFDPIHLGHLILGENAYAQCGLDKVLIMPSGQPPHKDNTHITDEIHRSTMIKLAIAENSHLQYSGLELERSGYIYTAETLKLLTQENPDIHYFFILGEDSLLEVEGWKNAEQLFKLCTIVAAHRNDEDDNQFNKQIQYLQSTYNADIIKLDVPLVDISSTDIRNRVQNGETIRYFVTSEVEKYIYKNNLYKEVLC